jgi:hypothetical protein
MRIGIYVRETYKTFPRTPSDTDLRMVTWDDDSPWSDIPPAGGNWVHCSAWATESFERVNYIGPSLLDQGAGDDFAETCDVSLEVFTTQDVMRHLVERHGFTGH